MAGNLLDRSGIGLGAVVKVVAVVSDCHDAPEVARPAKSSVLGESRSCVDGLTEDEGDAKPPLSDSSWSTSKTEKVLSGLTLTCLRFRCDDLELDGPVVEEVKLLVRTLLLRTV